MGIGCPRSTFKGAFEGLNSAAGRVSGSQERHEGVNPRLLKDHAMAVSRAIGPSDRKTNLAIVIAMHDCPSMFPMISSSSFSNFSVLSGTTTSPPKRRRDDFTRSSPSSSWLGVVVMVFGHHARSHALTLRWCGARGADTMLRCQRLRTARVHVVSIACG